MLVDHVPSEALSAILAAIGTIVVLVGDRRAFVLGGLVLLAVAEVALGATLVDVQPERFVSPVAVAALAAAAVFVFAFALLFVRFAAAVPAIALAVAPLRLPLDVDADHRFLIARAEAGELGRLLPLYFVLATAALALVIRLVRGAEVRTIPRELALPVAGFVAFACLSLTWSLDRDAGADRLAFYLIPFLVLVVVIANSPVSTRLPGVLGIVAVALAVLFSAVGIIQAATHRLLFFAPSVEIANAYGPVFRVTSLFTDPSLYGRHVVLGFAVLLVAIWLRRINLVAAVVLGVVLWLGLYFSYSQSSMTALFAVAVAVPFIAGTRVTRRAVVVAAVAMLVVAAAVAVNDIRDESLRRATSDRSRRVEIALRVFADQPIVGVGVAAQARASQERDRAEAPQSTYVSHNAPLTVAAELGTVGLALYCTILIGAIRVIDRIRGTAPALALGLAAALIALFVHALFYSGFFEDPVTWFAFGLAGAFAAERAAAEHRAPALGRAGAAARPLR